MTPPDKRRPAALRDLWLAESVRFLESGAALDDAAANATARASEGQAVERIVKRAHQLAKQEQLDRSVEGWRRRATWLLAAVALISAAAGFAAALAVLGDGSRPVNVVWALLGLLGVPSLMLALWLVSLAMKGDRGGSAVGRWWLWASKRTGGRQAPAVAAGLASVLRQHGLLRWGLGAVSHLVWAAFLLGTLAGLLLALSARRYGFAWETTILPQAPFVSLVAALGWLPAQLGFAIPDADLVRASGDAPALEATGRRLWSAWLVGCVLAYGLLPRLAAGLVCVVAWFRDVAALRIDLGEPYYQALAMRLSPESRRLGVLDPAPTHLPELRIAPPGQVSGRGTALVGVELRPGLAWPPDLPPLPPRMLRIDSREQRHQALAELRTQPPARLLIACDPRLSPDRGTLALIVDLSRHAGRCGVWLVDADAGEPSRVGHWTEALTALGLPAADIVGTHEAARQWLEVEATP